MLSVTGVSKRYGSIHALRDVGLELDRGEIVALVGENGAGKSTLVRCIAGAIAPDTGSISIDGAELGRNPREAIHQGVSVVWQDLALCENLDVTANLFLGRELTTRSGLRRAAMHSHAAHVFTQLGVTMPGLDRPIERLSGGQRQLVAIARATIDLPKVLVLDEPTAALGIAETRTVLGVVKTLQARGVSILLVSHQLDEVFDLADRIVVLRHGSRIADLHRAETHPDDVVAMITGANVDTTAGQQLRRLHSLAEQLSDADQSSVLPLTVSSLSNALSAERLAIFLLRESPDGALLHCSASLHLPLELEQELRELPVGRTGGFLGSSAATATLVVVPQLVALDDDPVASLAVAHGLAGAWAAPIVGQRGTLAVIVGFTEAVAQLQPDQVQLLELFSTMAGAAIERGQLVETLRARNQSLEGLRGVLETLAGPELLRAGLPTALDALCRGISCDMAALLVSGAGWEERATSTVLHGESRRAAVETILKAARHQDPDGGGVLVSPFDWSRGRAALACLWESGVPSDEGIRSIEGAANSFRLAMERELALDAAQEAAALQRSRAIERELTRRLGHELRTPLTAIRGFSSTMLQPDVEWAEEDKQRFLRAIESEAGRMGRLVAQLFDDSAIESGTLRLDFNYCDLVATLQAAVSIVGPAGAVTMAAPTSYTVWADSDRLEQVFVNLVGNALRHNAKGTTVVVDVTDRADSVVVTVTDDGGGMPRPVVDYLNGRREDFGSPRGLGIRLARGFVRAHGGTITATSGPDGTRIAVELPAEAAAG